MLIVPQQGRAHFVTEPGIIAVAPGEVAVIPRGLRRYVAIAARRDYAFDEIGGLLRNGAFESRCLTARRGAISAKITARCFACRSSARLAQTALPIRATFSARSRSMKTPTSALS